MKKNQKNLKRKIHTLKCKNLLIFSKIKLYFKYPNDLRYKSAAKAKIAGRQPKQVRHGTSLIFPRFVKVSTR